MLEFQRLSGIHPGQVSPVDVVGNISPIPLLLIYGEYEALSGEHLYEAANEPKELWIMDGVGHGAYQLVAPEAYEERIISFFEAHLLSSEDS